MTGSPTWHESGDLGARAAVLADEFRQEFGTPPAGIWAAPGRVNLIGEHVDYAGGLCLPLALPHVTLVAAGTDPLERVVGRSLQRPGEPLDIALADVGPGTPRGWGAYVAGVAWVLRQERGVATGLRVLIDTTVPVGAGLSSSAALSCATALAIDGIAGLGLQDDGAGRRSLAAACVRAENEVALAPTGGMDQAAALRSREGCALLLDCRSGSVRQLPTDLSRQDLALLVIDTRAAHSHVDGGYAHRRAAIDDATRALGVTTLRDLVGRDVDEVLTHLEDPAVRPLVRHVLTEIARVEHAALLLTGRDLAGLGPLLDASHASLRDDFRVSSPELDLAVQSARSSGALGARMTGGGFGGSAVALVPSRLLHTVAAAVDDAFAAGGFGRPAFLRAEPSRPGRRLL